MGPAGSRSFHTKHQTANDFQKKFHSPEESVLNVPLQDQLSSHPGIGRMRKAKSMSLGSRPFYLDWLRCFWMQVREIATKTYTIGGFIGSRK